MKVSIKYQQRELDQWPDPWTRVLREVTTPTWAMNITLLQISVSQLWHLDWTELWIVLSKISKLYSLVNQLRHWLWKWNIVLSIHKYLTVNREIPLCEPIKNLRVHYMATQRYRISLRVLIFYKWAQWTSEIFFNMRREISYLQVVM